MLWAPSDAAAIWRRGSTPAAFTPIGWSSPGARTRQNMSPPNPQASGMMTHSTACAAIIASAALPPCSSKDCPAATASGCAAAIAPLRPVSTGRAREE